MHRAPNKSIRPESQGVLKVMSRLLNEKAVDTSLYSRITGCSPKCEEYPIQLGGSGGATRISLIRAEGLCCGLAQGPFRLEENPVGGYGADSGRTGTHSPEIQEPAGLAKAGGVDSGVRWGRGDSGN